jgi:LPS-assembly lipoprotein
MSSFDRLRSFDRFRLVACRPALACILALGLAGCIHPLYGPNGVSAQLSQIEVAPIPDRVGHYLAEELKFQTDGSGAPPPPKYRLIVTTTESVGGLIVNLHTLTSDAASVTLNATYSLVEIEGGREVARGSASATASYDRSQQRFANVRAARDAEIRAASVLADQIRTRIGIALLDRK